MRLGRSGMVGALVLVAAGCAACGSSGSPGPDTATATIGTGGGSVAVDGAELSVPAGALAADVEITVTRTSDSAPTGYEQDSPIFRFEPAGTTFAIPADLRIQVSGSGTAMQLQWTGPATDDSFYAAGGTVQSGTLVGNVSHFSRGFAGLFINGPLPDGGTGPTVDGGGLPTVDGGTTFYDAGPFDQDGDGWPNATDNCPSIANADQADADHDGIGDVCEPYQCSDGLDNDHDGLIDTADSDCSGPTDATEGAVLPTN